MKDARTELRDSVIVLDHFDPKAYENAEPPLVSIYLPIHRTQREDRRDEWDKVEFKDLKEEAERTLRKKFPKEEDWAGIAERLDYLLQKEDLPLWVNAGKSLGLFVTNSNVFAFNLEFDVKPAVVVSDTFYVKPLLRNWQYGTQYYILELGNDRFSWVKGNRNGVKRQHLPQEVHDYFSQLFANSDDTVADMRKDEEGSLDYITLEGHLSPYHDRKSRKEVSQEEFEKFARYVNKAVDDYLVDKDTTPIILCCAPEHVSFFRKISTLRHLLPVGIEKDPAGLDGKMLLEDALTIMDAQREANVKQVLEQYALDASKDRATDDYNAIALALLERKVGVLLVQEGKDIPGTYDPKTGEMFFNPAGDPKDDLNEDPASPDLVDAFAQAALAQDAHIYVLPAEKMPADRGVAAIYRY